MAITQNTRNRTGHGFEGLDGCLSLPFLVDTKSSVQDDYGQDDDGIGQTMTAFCDDGQDGCCNQDDNHQVLELVKEFHQEGPFFPLVQFIAAILS